jgi:catechol 2,3-dioxygenase-like lactoylglutathione lyase family enzyme
MPQISGLHHVTLPATDALRSSDWFERVFGFRCVLIREEEDQVTMVTMGHPSGAVLYIHNAPGLVEAWRLAWPRPHPRSAPAGARGWLAGPGAGRGRGAGTTSRSRPGYR